MAEDGRGKGRLGEEDIAGNRLERRAGGVVPALVVAGHHRPFAPIFQHDLRGAEHMARRHEAHADIADPDLFAIADGLRMSRLAITRAPDGKRPRRGEHMAVTAARMGRLAVGWERAFRRTSRTAPKNPGRTVGGSGMRVNTGTKK